MKLIQQFDLNLGIIKDLGKDLKSIPPNVEEFIKNLSKEGYTVLKSTADFMGIPQSITIIKDSTSTLTTKLATKAKEDFLNISQKLGIDRLFD